MRKPLIFIAAGLLTAAAPPAAAWRSMDKDDMTSENPESGAALPAGYVQLSEIYKMRGFDNDEILNRDVVDANDNAVGDIEAIVEQKGELYAIVGMGGFLGLGEKEVAIRLDDLYVNQEEEDGGAPFLSGKDRETLEKMAPYDPKLYQKLSS